MFTGIIEEVGSIRKIESIAGGKRLQIYAPKILADVKVDDSVSVNGVCLTVTKINGQGFWIDAVGETLQKTTLDSIKLNQKVNLERAVRLQDRLGGHMVQGHVNGKGQITRIEKLGENYALDVSLNQDLLKYMIPEGSVALNGISLTIARMSANNIGINIIPHTWTNTNLRDLKVGDYLNVEVDVIAKYVERLLDVKVQGKSSGLTMDRINELGF